jgi:hypothetical protein
VRTHTLLLLALVTIAACTAPAVQSGAPDAGSPAAPSVAPSATARRAPSLRLVDWGAVLRADSDLDVSDVPASSGETALHVRVRGQDISGTPDIQGILFADLDSDGAEEAVIALDSGGTAGVIGFLVYDETPTGPKLVAARSGYKLGLTVAAGELSVSTPLAGGWEPNCCPSALETTSYRLEQGQLVAVRRHIDPVPEARARTVARFYELLEGKQYEDAYRFLSPAFQAASPFPTWLAGFATTERIRVTARENADGTVDVDLAVTERQGDREALRRFTGRWTLIFSPERKQWLLDRAEIVPVP